MNTTIESSLSSRATASLSVQATLVYAFTLLLALGFLSALLAPTKADACGYSYYGCGGSSYGSYNYVQYPYQVYNYFPQPVSTNSGGSLFNYNYNPQPYQVYNYYPQQTSNQSGSWFNYTPQPQQIYVYYNKDTSYLNNYRRY